MTQKIELKYYGMCEGCTCSDLKLTEYGMANVHGKTLWTVKCTHVNACERMLKRKRGDKVETNDEDKQALLESLKAQVEELKLKKAELEGERRGLLYALKCKGVNIDE